MTCSSGLRLRGLLQSTCVTRKPSDLTVSSGAITWWHSGHLISIGAAPDRERMSSAHQRPAGSLEVFCDVMTAPFAMASLGRRPLMDSATVRLPAVEDHDIFAVADKFHVGIGAWLCR